MLTSLDHIALVVPDLQRATDGYATLLGREPNWHGADDGVEHVWFQLDNIALDIMAPTGSGSLGDRVRAQIDQHGEGIWALGFATPDIAKARRTLQRRGIDSSEVHAIRSTHVDSKETRCWVTSTLAADATFGTTIFLVEQKSDAAHWPRSTIIAPQLSCVNALDHIVVTTSHPERAAALYGARLGLEMKLDRTNPDWGSRLMFFKCGDLVVEIAHSLKNADPSANDKVWGLSWRAPDIAATHDRIDQAGCNISTVRTGRKPGTQVFTVRDAPASVPTLVIGRSAESISRFNLDIDSGKNGNRSN